MATGKPSLDLLRALTDEHLLRALMAHDRLTRAELATLTGLSKPTVSEGIRRLVDVDLVVDTGARTRGRGRVGSYYALSPAVGVALVVSVSPEAVVAEVLDARGEVTGRSATPVERPARSAVVARAVADCADEVCRGLVAPPRLAVVSAADPVDRATGRLVHLPDAPFLVGDLSPVEVLASVVRGPVLVDNDVNWAARAEVAAGDEQDLAYLHLGEGLGCAVVGDGEVRRGHHGFVGEIAHVVTVGPRGRAVPFTEVFAGLGLRHPGTTAVDVAALVTAAESRTVRGRRTLAQLSDAVAGVLAAVVALADPAVVVLGGSWGSHPAVVEGIREACGRGPRPTPIRSARLRDEPALVGARASALEALRTAVVGAAAPPAQRATTAATAATEP